MEDKNVTQSSKTCILFCIKLLRDPQGVLFLIGQLAFSVQNVLKTFATVVSAHLSAHIYTKYFVT